jgi:AhpC/TSA family/Disulphide bond corrector protein DsbC
MMLEQNGVRIAAVSYDAPEILAAFAQRHAIGFPLLSDRDSEIIRRFGIFNFNMAPELRAYGVPHPVEYLVARDGTVVNKYFVPNYQHRVTGSAVALRQFGTVDREAPAVTLASGALAVRIGFPSAKAFAGQEVTFFAKFSLQPGWHIYGAPLPEGCTATSITFDSPNVGSQKLELPAAEMLHFPVLRETLPVYTSSFQWLGRLLLKHPLPDGKLVLPGSLGFQMCSDTVCEPPQVLPFQLALTLEPFLISDRDKRLHDDRTRVPEAGAE